jgi:hypothetical protein
VSKAEKAMAAVVDFDLNELLWGKWQDDYGVVKQHSEDLDESRWTMHTRTTFIFDDDSCLSFEWERGLTENQDHDGPYTMFLSKPHEIVTVEYRRLPS